MVISNFILLRSEPHEPAYTPGNFKNFIDKAYQRSIMTIGAFDLLSENEKLEAILNSGRVISEARDQRNRSFLYFLGSFYTSVKYNSETDELTEIKTFERIDREERTKWKVLRALPSLHVSRKLDKSS